MTDVSEAEPAQFVPETWERGRYRVLTTPDGGLLINRTADLCENCQNCGCGEPRDPIGPVPGPLVQMMQERGKNGGGFDPRGMLAGMRMAMGGAANGRRAGRAAKRR